MEESASENVTFESLGIHDVLIGKMKNLGWHSPSQVQKELFRNEEQHFCITGAQLGGKSSGYVLKIANDIMRNKHHDYDVYAIILCHTLSTIHKICGFFRVLGCECKCLTGAKQIDRNTFRERDKSKFSVVVADWKGLQHLGEVNLKYMVLEEAELLLTIRMVKKLSVALRLIEENLEMKKLENFQIIIHSSPMIELQEMEDTLATIIKQAKRIDLPPDSPLHIKVFTDESDKAVNARLAGLLKKHVIHKRVSCVIFLNKDINPIEKVIRRLNGRYVASIKEGESVEMLQNIYNVFGNKDPNIMILSDKCNKKLLLHPFFTNIVINLDLPVKEEDFKIRLMRVAPVGPMGQMFTIIKNIDVEHVNTLFRGLAVDVQDIAKQEKTYNFHHDHAGVGVFSDKEILEQLACAEKQGNTKEHKELKGAKHVIDVSVVVIDFVFVRDKV